MDSHVCIFTPPIANCYEVYYSTVVKCLLDCDRPFSLIKTTTLAGGCFLYELSSFWVLRGLG